MKKRMSVLLAACLMLLSMSCALAECSVCGGDGQCDQCLGLGFLMARVFNSNELVQVSCSNPQCSGGRCTACSGSEQAVSGAYVFQDESMESAVCAALGKGAHQVTPDDLRSLSRLDVEILSGPVVLDDLKQMPSLETLTLRCTASRKLDVDLAPVSELTRLKEFTLGTTGEVQHFNVLLRLPKLEIINLEGTAMQLNLNGLLDQGLMTRSASGALVSFDGWYEQNIYSQMFVQTADNSSLCSVCGGLGRQTLACKECDGKGASVCHACEGTGVGTNARLCTYCRGSGKRDCHSCNGNNVRRCGECLGTGEKNCTLCDKTGVKTLTCANCGGDGLQ